MNYKLSLLLLLELFCRMCYGYFVTVDAHAEECFFDRVKPGTKLALTFETSEGGFLDIDVRIYDPNQQIIHKGDRETSGKYTFAANADGVYTYCFSNKMSTMTPKVVLFNMEIGEAFEKGSEAVADESSAKLDEMINQLSNSLRTVKHEQDYMGVRDKIHRNINESTNSRVVTWAFFEAMVLVVMVIGQVMYLKRFFEVRRVV